MGWTKKEKKEERKEGRKEGAPQFSSSFDSLDLPMAFQHLGSFFPLSPFYP